MVTDWFHNPRVLVLAPMVVAMVCALVLVATRGILSPEHPRWRIARAAFLGGCIHLPGFVMVYFLGRRASILTGPSVNGFDASAVALISFTLAYGVFLGWLIPVVIEGRSLRDIGWRLPPIGWLVAVVLVGAAIVAARLYSPPATGLEDMVPEAPTGLLAVIGSPAILLWAFVSTFIAAAWVEENVFRGYLLPALQENGLSGRAANLTQAAFFAALHVPAYAVVAASSASADRPLIAVVAVGIATWLGWGLLFGWLRLRSNSIVPGFLLHGLNNLAWYLAAYSGAAGILAALR